MFTIRFWKLAAERAIKVFAESFAAVLVASGAGLLDADWRVALSTAGMATVVSVLTSVASANIGPKDSPSVVRDEPAPALGPPAEPTPASVAA